MNYDSCTVDELIERGAAAVPSIFTNLSTITATAADHGVTVTVNLEGRLTDLSLEPHALAVSPAALAATIVRLTDKAAADALTKGIETLAPHLPDELLAELRPVPTPTPTPVPRQPEDLSTIETWAVPH